MIKMIGIIAVIASAGALGLRCSHSLRDRLTQLRQIERAFYDISTALQYTSATTSEIVDMLKHDGKLGFFSQLDPLDLSGSLSRSEEFRRLDINSEEREIVKDVFSRLGGSDLATQLAMIEYNKTRIGAAAARCGEECSRKCSLYDRLGFLGGIFVSLLII